MTNTCYYLLANIEVDFCAQDKNSVNGKIIKINLDDKSYKLFSMGHRNPQGLFFDKKNNIILKLNMVLKEAMK